MVVIFAICIVFSSIAIRIGMSLSERFGIEDHPGGHKQHDTSTPFVGGFGIIAALLITPYLAVQHFPDTPLPAVQAITLGAIILFLTGLADDIWHLNFRTRFVVQTIVALNMVFLGGIKLHSLGEILPGLNIELGLLAVPFTIFATIGLINAINMIDGIDGLSGTLSLISLGFIGVVAGFAGNGTYLILIVALMGGVVGFLFYNLRYPSNGRARVFLGDNGSMLLGFVFAWLFIALSQGEQRAMTPVTALWLLGVPLMDTVGVMLRRIWLGKSPFHADRSHLHHLFIRAGFRVSDTVWAISLTQLVLGVIGLVGLAFGLPDSLMFGLFLGTFAIYFYVISRPWRFVPNLRRMGVALGLPSSQARGIFIGRIHAQACDKVLEMLTAKLSDHENYRVSFHKQSDKPSGAPNIFALVEFGGTEDEATMGEIRRLMLQIRSNFNRQADLRVSLFMQRSRNNERRSGGDAKTVKSDELFHRVGDRRTSGNATELHLTKEEPKNTEPYAYRV